MLEEKGVYADVKLTECAMDWIPFDDDVLSMELDGSLRECALVSAVFICSACACARVHVYLCNMCVAQWTESHLMMTCCLWN